MFRPLSSQNSDAANYGQINDMIRSLNKEQQTKTFRGPNQINALTTGKLKDLGYGLLFRDSSDVPRIAAYIDENNNPILKVSKSGFDATTTGDANLIFNSAQNVFKIVGTGTSSFPSVSLSTGAGGGWSGDVQTTTINHGLSYVPIVLAFIQRGSNYLLTPWTFLTTGGTGVNIASYYIDATSTQLLVTTSGLMHRTGADSATLGPWNLKYYLLQETAN